VYSNNDPKVVATHLVQAITTYGAAKGLHSDCGTETTVCAAIMSFNHQNETAHIYGKSTANQRIEALWSKLRSVIIPWIDFFHDMVSDNLLMVCHRPHMQIIRYCFSNLVQESLYDFMLYWNSHKIRKTSECPTGKPDILYFSGNDKGTNVTDYMFTEIRQYCAQSIPVTGCDQFDGYCQYIRNELNLEMPAKKQEARYLYCRILEASGVH
jgi:hypothetical protein